MPNWYYEMGELEPQPEFRTTPVEGRELERFHIRFPELLEEEE